MIKQGLIVGFLLTSIFSYCQEESLPVFPNYHYNLNWSDTLETTIKSFNHNGTVQFSYHAIGSGKWIRSFYSSEGNLLSKAEIIFRLDSVFKNDVWLDGFSVNSDCVKWVDILHGQYIEFDQNQTEDTLIRCEGQFNENVKIGIWTFNDEQNNGRSYKIQYDSEGIPSELCKQSFINSNNIEWQGYYYLQSRIHIAEDLMSGARVERRSNWWYLKGQWDRLDTLGNIIESIDYGEGEPIEIFDPEKEIEQLQIIQTALCKKWYLVDQQWDENFLNQPINNEESRILYLELITGNSLEFLDDGTIVIIEGFPKNGNWHLRYHGHAIELVIDDREYSWSIYSIEQDELILKKDKGGEMWVYSTTDPRK